MEKIISIALYVMMVISVLLAVLFVTDTTSEELIIMWCYLLVGVAALSAVVFPIIRMAQDFTSAKNSLIGVGALLVVFGVSYSLASSEVLSSYEEYLTDEGSIKMIGGSIIAFYILAAGAIGSAIYSEVSSMMK